MAGDGQHPHLAAVLGSAPDAATPTAEEGLRRMLTIVFDGVFGRA